MITAAEHLANVQKHTEAIEAFAWLMEGNAEKIEAAKQAQGWITECN